MKWKPHITDEGITERAIESGPWRISKAQMEPGLYRYALHRNGGEVLAFASDAETLKGMASEQQ